MSVESDLHCWRDKDVIVSEVLLWDLTQRQAGRGRQAKMCQADL